VINTIQALLLSKGLKIGTSETFFLANHFTVYSSYNNNNNNNNNNNLHSARTWKDFCGAGGQEKSCTLNRLNKSPTEYERLESRLEHTNK